MALTNGIDRLGNMESQSSLLLINLRANGHEKSALDGSVCVADFWSEVPYIAGNTVPFSIIFQLG
jgi:hypothetical protein